MEIDGKISKSWLNKNVSFFVENYFSVGVVSPDKKSDLTVNNTHSQSSISFPLNKSIATPE